MRRRLPQRTTCLALAGFAFGTLLAGVPRAALAGGPASTPLLDIDYVYSLIDNTNNSTSLSDGKSWVVRYYRRIAGEAGNTPATNPHPCQLDSTTGKNMFFVGGTTTDANSPSYQDCWWDFLNAWKAQALSQPGVAPGNLTDHYFHLTDVDTNPYVSQSSLSSARTNQPGPFNAVILTIPGAVDPEQTVVIGEHPDGASLSTFGSAYDDGQGGAEVVGIARSLLTYWTQNHLWPARTVQFVLFDGEEEGLYGSFYYQSQLVPPGSIDANQYRGVFNVDQNGIAYPARHFGTPDKPGQGPWYLNVAETPVSDFSFYTQGSNYWTPRIAANKAQVQAFQAETNQVVQQTFAQLGQLYAGQPMPLAGYQRDPAIGYPGDCTPATCVDTFQSWANDSQYILQYDDNSGGTDQDPFIRCGVNAYGLYGAWDTTQQEPVTLPPTVKEPVDIPFAGYDTPADNVAWLNWLASGSLPPSQADVSPTNEIDPSKLGSEAVRRALQFTGQLVINSALQSDMAGAVAVPTSPIAYFLPDRYAVFMGAPLTFNAIPSPVAASYQWTFDDGATASGTSTSHSFATTGLHTVQLTATAPSGSSTYRAQVNVVAAGGDLNTNCGTVAGEQAPTFVVSPASSVPEIPLTAPLAGIGAGAFMIAIARRRRRTVT